MEPNYITGEWKNFTFKVVEEVDFDLVLNNLKVSFFVDEPIHQVVGITPERANDLEKRIRTILAMEDTISFMAIDKATAKVAGVLIIVHFSKDTKFPELKPTSPLTKIVRSFVHELNEKVDIFSKYKVEQYAEAFIVSTLKEYRGRGLGSEMYRRAISVVKAMGYTLIASTFSNPYSRKIGEKFGFEEISRSYFHETRDENGEKTMPNATRDQYACVTVLKLKQ